MDGALNTPQATSRPFRLGLTGGIGSGKSTFGAMLADCGAALVDADRIAREATAPGGVAIPSVRAAFGPSFIDAAGALDRGRMRELVFADPSAKQKLESIVHPHVTHAMVQAAQEAVTAGHRLVVFDIPLLVESDRWARQLDAVIVIDCPVQVQVQRVQARSQLSARSIEAIIQAQASRERRRAAADVVVHNDGLSLTDLHTKARQIAALFGL